MGTNRVKTHPPQVCLCVWSAVMDKLSGNRSWDDKEQTIRPLCVAGEQQEGHEPALVRAAASRVS